MNVYVAEWEEDGRTVKAPGVTETEVKAFKRYFVAGGWNDVWAATEYLRTDPERTFKGIGVVLESVVVLPTSYESEKG